jgi:hypothetical protein
MKLSRRQIFQLSLGGTQMALLSQFTRKARAANPIRPTKLLGIWIDGGLQWESMFTPLTRAGIAKYVPAPQGDDIPMGYNASQVENFDGSPVDLESTNVIQKLRGPVYFDRTNPSATGPIAKANGAQRHVRWGYSWADPKLKVYERAALLVGADQGAPSHEAGKIAALCGVAGANFRAPAVHAVVANAMAERFPDRPLPNVNLSGTGPSAFGLPARANPLGLRSISDVGPTLSDQNEGAWKGLRKRTEFPNLKYDGTAGKGTLPVTVVDKAVLEAVRKERALSTKQTDATLERLYDTYKQASKTIARDVLAAIGKTKGFEFLGAAVPEYAGDPAAFMGQTNNFGPLSSVADFDFALRLLKSDLVTSVNLRATSVRGFVFDTHYPPDGKLHSAALHITFEQVGRLIAEMSLTPIGGGRTLLDDTLVYVYSDFGRTSQTSGPATDHHPTTCAILAGGSIVGNQMLGAYDESYQDSPLGRPVALLEESGQPATRTSQSQDVAATVLTAFGLKPGTDYFIPGGYGSYIGAVTPDS